MQAAANQSWVNARPVCYILARFPELIRCGRHLRSPTPKHRPVTARFGKNAFLGELPLVWWPTLRIYLRWNNAEKPHSDGRQGDREVHLRALVPEESRELGRTCALSAAIGRNKRTPGLKGERIVMLKPGICKLGGSLQET